MSDRKPAWSLDAAVRPAAGVLSCEVDGEIVILEQSSGRYYGLDRVAAEVWSGIERERHVAGACRRLLEKYDVSEQRLRADVSALLEGLASRGLVERDGQ